MTTMKTETMKTMKSTMRAAGRTKRLTTMALQTVQDVVALTSGSSRVQGLFGILSDLNQSGTRVRRSLTNKRASQIHGCQAPRTYL